jgi:hypothetical protein
MSVLRELKKEGKIRRIGFSGGSASLHSTQPSLIFPQPTLFRLCSGSPCSFFTIPRNRSTSSKPIRTKTCKTPASLPT